MKTHAIIPIFIPHLGCPQNCVFCNQKTITAKNAMPDRLSMAKTIESYMSTLSSSTVKTIELAFYGGSFTALDTDLQNYYLDLALNYKENEVIDRIHMSTRPDAIDPSILENLKNHKVDTIELGVQSFDEEVLRKSNRGHDAKSIYKAAELIKNWDFHLGIQLMTGLPGDSLAKNIYSAEETVRLNPSLARIYPVIVFGDTELHRMMKEGRYLPPSEETMIENSAEIYKILMAGGIRIMRVGLKSTDYVSNEKTFSDYHPAFRQLVEGKIALEMMTQKLPMRNFKSATFTSNNRWFNSMIGHGGINKKYLIAKYDYVSFNFSIDEDLPDGVIDTKIDL